MDNYLDQLVSELASAFGGSLSAVYLTGSTAVGRNRRGKSDIDVLVAVKHADRPALDQVVSECSHDALPCPATKLELVVYELAALRELGSRPNWSLNFNTGAHVQHAGFDPALEPAHWFVLDLAFARRHARPLVGPPADRLIDDPSEQAIDDAFAAMVEWYERNEPDGVARARARAAEWSRARRFVI